MRINLEKISRNQEKHHRLWVKKGDKLQSGYKLHSIIAGDYELIKKFKTATSSFYAFQVDLLEKMKWFTDTEDTLKQNQKVMI
jgi:hypothetical protein